MPTQFNWQQNKRIKTSQYSISETSRPHIQYISLPNKINLDRHQFANVITSSIEHSAQIIQKSNNNKSFTNYEQKKCNIDKTDTTTNTRANSPKEKNIVDFRAIIIIETEIPFNALSISPFNDGCKAFI